jgi:hypothetical protein
MTENDRKLGYKKRRAIAALLTQPNQQAAAAAAGVTDRTLRRWMDDPLFQASLNTAQLAILQDAVRMLLVDLEKSLTTIRDLRDNPNESSGVRLRAAQSLLAVLMDWRTTLSFEERIATLERLFADDNQYR